METQFKKGNSGKPKGAKNKITSEIREKFDQLLQSVTVEQMAQDLLTLKPAERMNIIMGLAEYLTPKLARTQMKHEMPELPTEFKINIVKWEGMPPLASSEKDVVM